MRTKLSLLAASSALVALTAHAAIDLGNGVKVVPNATVQADFTDNLFLTRANQQDEVLIKLSPGILFSMGEGAVNYAQFTYNEEFQFYNEQSELDTSLSLVDFMSRYDDGKMKINASAWWHEANQATRDTLAVSSLVKRDLLRGELTDEVQWTEKSSVKLGITYDKTDYHPSTYADLETWEIPVNYYYAVLPKLDTSFGFRYRTSDVSGGTLLATGDSDEFFYNVGLRGELTAKLTAEIAVGYLQFEPDGASSESTLGVEGRLDLAASAKTSFGVTASNRYGYSGLGESYRTGGLGATFTTEISAEFSLNGSLYYNTYEYLETSRDDAYYGGSITANYKVNEHVAFRGSYTYSKNDSNVALYDFDNNIISVAATLKY